MSSQSCDAGEAGTGTNGVCEACAVGQFRKAGTDANSCIGCIVGRYQPETGQASCLPCIPGSFMDITGATKCKKCNENFKSETPGSTKCLACGTGKRSSNGSAVCQDCQPGEAGTPCSKCEPGKYRGETDETTACKTCVIGQSSTKGSSSCTKCDLGRYGSSSNPGVCTECIDKKEYQDTKGQTKCLSCTLGEKWISLISSCTKCTFGQYGSENGTCVICNAGRFQDEPGKHECKDCSVDTYLSEKGKSSKADCLACPTERSTGTAVGNINSTACLCKRKDYYQSKDGNCLACPVGADCSDHDGITLAELGTQPGYWRINASTTEFADCARGFSSSTSPKNDSIQRCPGSKNQNKSFNSDLQCRNINETEAYGGPACMSCLDERYTMSGNICTYCPEGASVGKAIVALTGVMAFLFLIFALLFMKAKEEDDQEDKKKKKKKGCCGGINDKQKPDVNKQTKQQKIEAQRGTNAASRLAGDQALVGRMQGSGGGGGEGAADGANGLNEAYRSDSQVVTDRVKIIYGWLQIFTALTFTFDIAWPIQLKSFSLNLNFINLDMGNILSASACSFAIPFLEKMAVHAAVPIMLFITLSLARVPAYVLHKKHRTRQRALFIKLGFSLALILYPGLCTRLFSSLKTTNIVGIEDSVLAVDYSINAFQEQHMPFVFLTIGCMVVYVLGIPISVCIALRKNKKYLYSAGTTEEHRRRHEEVVDEFGTLYLQYEPKYWYWEVTVILKKMLLTGAMTIVAAGSSAQMVIALLIVLLNLLLVLKLGPFVDSTDDWLAFLTSMQMLLTLLGGLLIMTDNTDEPTYDSTFMGVTMIVVNSFGFFALVLSLIMLHPKMRKKCNKVEQNIDDRNLSTCSGTTKVTPMRHRDLKIVDEEEEDEDRALRNWGK